MFNYYINEKLTKNLKEIEKEKEKQKLNEIKRRSKSRKDIYSTFFIFLEKMQKLVSKYENRMREFVLKMAEKPVMVKKSKDKFYTTRQEFLSLTSNKILDKKGFQFKSYKSDKERINEFLKGKESLDRYLEKISIEKKRKEKIKKKRNEPKLIQPSMRFTARTDFERVYDILKNRQVLYEEEKIIKSQLAKMGFTSQNIEDNEEDEESERIIEKEIISNKKNENLTDEEIFQKERHNKIIQQRKNMINKRKFLLNIEQDKDKKLENNKMKYLSGNLYPRTYFKTMENLTMFRTSTINHNVFKKWKKEDEKKQQNIKINNVNRYNNNYFHGLISSYFPKIERNPEFKKISSFDEKNNNINNYDNLRNIAVDDIFMNNKKITLNERQKQFNFVGNKKILEELEITKDIANTNPLLFNLNFNNTKNDNTITPKIEDQLSVLKMMAFEKNDKLDDSFTRNLFEKNDFDDFKKEDNIIIDGKEYKKSETYKIADKVLKKCNYNENKVKYNSNEGGLMFTNGLTINDFEAKYGL